MFHDLYMNLSNQYHQNPIELPPSTGNTIPVIYLAFSVQRNKAASPMSAGVPSLPIGVREITLFIRSLSSFKALADISVAINPGAIQFTLIPNGDKSTAIALVI